MKLVILSIAIMLLACNPTSRVRQAPTTQPNDQPANASVAITNYIKMEAVPFDGHKWIVVHGNDETGIAVQHHPDCQCLNRGTPPPDPPPK